MKRIILAASTTLLTIAAFGQGVVNFSNASSTPGWTNPTFDRYVHWSGAAQSIHPALVPGGLVSSNYAGLNFTTLRAVLYYAPTSNNDPNLVGYVQASGGPATFKVSTSATAGSWFGGNRTLDNIPPGTTANLVVVVWNSSLSSDPLSELARTFWGSSEVFQYTPPSDPQAQPSAFLMTGLSAFDIPDVPEPSTVGLAAIGAAALLMLRLRRGIAGR